MSETPSFPAKSENYQHLFQSMRTDRWWVDPLLKALILIIFGAYTGWSMWIGVDFKYNHYISPIYSPEIEIAGWPFSPAFILIWAPLGFRFTCYYARRVYYRIFFFDPPSCAVNEVQAIRYRYKGENQKFPLPFVLNNLHRYFLYMAIILAAIHWVDTIIALSFEGGIGIGLGSVLIFTDALFLSLYVASCHSFRHLVGGGLNCYSCSKVRYEGWRIVSRLNKYHYVFFWMSLVWVVIVDLYIRLLVLGILSDPFIVLIPL
ncbi:MAG: succinate dehydrogenase [Candidatus Heimdallarchaeota archaeon]